MNGERESKKENALADQKAAHDIQLILENAAPDVIKKIPRKQREEISRLISMRQTTVSYSHSGPLPAAEELKKYDNVVAGCAERIVRMAEKQQDHRMSLETLAITEQLKQSGRGQHYGLMCALVLIVASFVAIMYGHDAAGGWLGGSTLVALVAVFVTGKVMQADDLKKKRVDPK